MQVGFSSLFTPAKRNGLIGWTNGGYLVGIASVELYGQFSHPYFFENKFPFFPLMLIFLYCAIGMVYSWLWQLIYILKHT
jgi:alpha-1,3-glucosyltransferase